MKIHNSSGLTVHFLSNGTIQSIESGSIRISLFEASPFCEEGANIYLRQRGETIQFIPLLGPHSNSLYNVNENSFIARGGWQGFEYTAVLQLSPVSESWRWNIDVKNNSNNNKEFDLVYVQDVGLKTRSDSPVNEYYASQYIERIILNDHNFGQVVCCRQNIQETGINPWLIISCSSVAESAATDGMLIYGASSRATGIPEGLLSDRLGGEYAGESSIVALQNRPAQLLPSQECNASFIASFLPDHPQATTPADLHILNSLRQQFVSADQTRFTGSFTPPRLNIMSTSKLLSAEELDQSELNHFFGRPWRHVESDGKKLLSFFTSLGTHVVLKAKECMVHRPHGQIMQANRRFEPSETIMSTTSYACGVFNSHITQGNTNFNSLLSVATNPFNLHRQTGQRIMVKSDGQYLLLGVPSAFEMGLNHCCWLYKYKNFLFQIITWASVDSPHVNLYVRELNGAAVSLVITHDFDTVNAWKVENGNTESEFLVRPAAGSMITQYYPDAKFRIIIHSHHNSIISGGSNLLYENGDHDSSELFVVKVNDCDRFCMSFAGEVMESAPEMPLDDPETQLNNNITKAFIDWQSISCDLRILSDNHHMQAISETLPWFASNALVHFLTPYGLEQFGGAAWGTRDVSQGPVELMLAVGKYAEARKTLCIIFSNQNHDGGWPQWWMFDRYSHIRAHEAHGDIIYWVLIALSNYVRTTADVTILDEILPFSSHNLVSSSESATVKAHINRLIDLIITSFVPGTALVSYGGGDWNDSLQPVNKLLAQRMISSWTVQMNYQAFKEYEQVCSFTGDNESAGKLARWCRLIQLDFKKHLIADNVVAGYGYVNDDGTIGLLLHPSDRQTGVKYSLLPMNRGVLSGIFTKEQTEYHQDLVKAYLMGPDGVRLMDRPLKYEGGIQKIFQRAESSTFFGREIGLMYIHEHIRYAEALARAGKAIEFVNALRLAVPVNYSDVVKCGDLRQANCYYSSSDAVFPNRYMADKYYHELIAGNYLLHGGWRVYSSGPGIFIALIFTRLLGIRIEYNNLVLDPVIPAFLDGLQAELTLLGYRTRFTYRVKQQEYSPKNVRINDNPVGTGFENNPYRPGGAVIPLNNIKTMLSESLNEIEIIL